MGAQNLSLFRLKFWAFFIFTSLFFANSRFALSQEKNNGESYFMCRLSGEVRTIRMLKRLDGSCYVNYTKNGIDQKISESKNTANCPEILQRIKNNLEQASWKCKNISSSGITGAGSNN